MGNYRLVYSTESGSLCAACQKPVSDCTCKKKKLRPQTTIKNDGKIRIQRETKGLYGDSCRGVSSNGCEEMVTEFYAHGSIAAPHDQAIYQSGSPGVGIEILQQYF